MKAVKFIAGGAAAIAAQLLAVAPAQGATYFVSGTFLPYTDPSYQLLAGGSFSGYFEVPDGTFPFPAGQMTYYDDPVYSFDVLDKNGVRIATVRDGPGDYAYSYFNSRGSTLDLFFGGGPDIYVRLRAPLNFNRNAALSDATVRVGSGGNKQGHLASGSIAAVPEPGTWAMMIGGFGLVGGAMRRRKIGVGLA